MSDPLSLVEEAERADPYRVLPRGVWWRKVWAMLRLRENGVQYPYDHPED